MRITGFMNIRSWLADVRENADPHVTCILVGNKVDLCKESSPPLQSQSSPEGEALPTVSGFRRAREVSVEEAEEFAKSEGLLFVESSAKSGLNVEKAFEDSAKEILVKIRQGVFDDKRVSIVFPYLFSNSFWFPTFGLHSALVQLPRRFTP